MAIARQRPHPPTADTPDLIRVEIDYKQSPFGAWTAELRFHDDPEEVYPFDGPDAHETMHHVLDYLDAYSVLKGCPIASVATLHGDPAAWVNHATAEGFISCATEGSHSSTIVTLDREPRPLE